MTLLTAIRAAVARYQYAEIRRGMTPAAIDAIFAGPVLGIEITDAALAGRCSLGNIDGQHGTGRLVRPSVVCGGIRFWTFAPHLSGETVAPVGAAIDLAGEIGAYDEKGMTLATSRADLDSVCAMARLVIRALPLAASDELFANEEGAARAKEMESRIRAVAGADNFEIGAKPWAPSPLPTAADPWAGAAGGVDSRRELAAINAAVQDGDVPLAERVEWAALWLLTGGEPTRCGECNGAIAEDAVVECSNFANCAHGGGMPSPYRARVEAARRDLVARIGAERMRVEFVGGAATCTACHEQVSHAFTPATQPGYFECPRCASHCPMEDADGRVPVTRQAGPVRLLCTGGIGPGQDRHAPRPSPATGKCRACGMHDAVAVVEVEHMGATGVGYCLAPVVVARRPSDGKITIASWGRRYDHAVLVATLNAAEQAAGGASSWGGNPASGIIGSPMREGTRLSLATVLAFIAGAVEQFEVAP